MQVADRVTRADRARALIAKQKVERSRLKAGRVGKTNERCKVVPVILIKADPGLAADELLCSKALCLATGSCSVFEEIAESRYAIQIRIFRLDRQPVRNGWNTHIVPAHAIVQRKVTFHTPLVLCEEREIFFLNSSCSRSPKYKTGRGTRHIECLARGT